MTKIYCIANWKKYVNLCNCCLTKAKTAMTYAILIINQPGDISLRYHCSDRWWMITFLQSSMASLKMQMSDSPSLSPPFLHSWSLLFDLFIFYVGEPESTMVSFINKAVFPLPGPCGPPEFLVYQATLMWPGHAGPALLGNRKKRHTCSCTNHKTCTLHKHIFSKACICSIIYATL